MIRDVVPNSAADNAGLKAGDEIVKVDDISVIGVPHDKVRCAVVHHAGCVPNILSAKLGLSVALYFVDQHLHFLGCGRGGVGCGRDMVVHNMQMNSNWKENTNALSSNGPIACVR